MTNEEKQNLTFGFSSTTNGCSGTSGSALRVGFPGLCLNDGPAGVRGTELVSGFASGVHVAASWNRDLAKARGQAIGQESKAKGGKHLKSALRPSSDLRCSECMARSRHGTAGTHRIGGPQLGKCCTMRPRLIID